MSYFYNIKLKSTYWAAIEIKRQFPELKHLDSEHVERNLAKLGVRIYFEENKKRPSWIRFTLPFAIIFGIFLIVISPLKYMATGKWSWRKDWIYNWFKSLGL